MSDKRDVQILRDLAKRYLDICITPEQDERRELWRKHNSLIHTRPLIFVSPGTCWNEFPESKLECEDPLFRTQEMIIKRWFTQQEIGDDFVFDPWLGEWAVYKFPAVGRWGFELNHIQSDMKGGAYKINPPIKDLDDAKRFLRPHHEIDEAATDAKMTRLRDAVGDIITVKSVRAPYYRSYRGDISTDLAQLRGLEELMTDMYDNPDWLHEVLSFMSTAIREMLDAGEQAGDWRLSDSANQAMPYSLELPDPGAHDNPVPMSQLWGYMASQETTLVSPEMFDEFMFQYQIPLMEKYGLVAYGCCEDLTRKIGVLRQLKNLRRIAVTPVADIRKSAEVIGADYVISWRPNPALMVCCGWDEARIRNIIREGLDVFDGLHLDITLKDTETLENEPWRLQKWVRIVREEIDAYMSTAHHAATR